MAEETNREKVLRIHGEQIRAAALAAYKEEHPSASTAAAVRAVDAILAGMTQTEAEAEYGEQQQGPVLPGTYFIPGQEPTEGGTDAVLPGTYAVGVAAPEDEDDETFGETVQRTSEAATAAAEETFAERSSRLSEMNPEELTRAILSELEDRGVNTDAPEVRVWASSQIAQNAYVNNREQFDALAQIAVEQFSSDTRSAYLEAVEASGLTDFEFPAPEPTGEGAQLIHHRPGLEVTDLPREFVRKSKDWYVHPESGALFFRNGVIVDTVSGQVLYPPSKDVAGSRTWLNNARSTWSDERIKKWKERLASLGYLPKEAVKDEAWNTSFQIALENYFTSKYQNFGRPLPFDEAAGGFGPGAEAIEHLGRIRATLESQIQDQWRATFGHDPSQAELETWTRLAIRIGNQLQRGSEGLEAGAAAGEAVSRIGQRLYGSGVATYQREAIEENTVLRDRLAQAVSATSQLAGG